MHQLTTWSLVLLTLVQRIQGDQQHIENCHEYCLSCGSKHDHNISNVSMEGHLEVSFQVSANGTLPIAQITLQEANPKTYIAIVEENVTLWNDKKWKRFQLPTSRHPGFSWITVILEPTDTNTLLVYSPEDRIHILKSKTSHSSLVTVSSNEETHVMFNCLSGCILRNSKSLLVSEKAILRPPFTMYLNPIVQEEANPTLSKPIVQGKPEPMPPSTIHLDSTPRSSRLNWTYPILTLNPDQGERITVNASQWTAGMWRRVDFLLDGGDENQGLEGGVDVRRIPNGAYSVQLQGFQWTLRCSPEGLENNLVSSAKPDPVNVTETSGIIPSQSDQEIETTEGDDSNSAERKTGAGAGQVTAWVMAGLALFLVLVLALALCTKTARQSPPHPCQEFQPSVGVIYYKNTHREPEEDSEPESTNELKVPTCRISGGHPGKDFKVLHD